MGPSRGAHRARRPARRARAPRLQRRRRDDRFRRDHGHGRPRPRPRRRTAPRGSPRVYFTAGEQLRPVPGPSDAARRPRGRSSRGRRSRRAAGSRRAIPAGTEVEGVERRGRDGDGARLGRVQPTGSPTRRSARSDDQQAELDARLAQVTFTMAGVDGVDRTRVLAAGRPVGGTRSRDDFAKPAAEGPEAEAGRAAGARKGVEPGPVGAGTARAAPLPAEGRRRRDRRLPDATGGHGVPGMGGARAGRNRRPADEGGTRRREAPAAEGRRAEPEDRGLPGQGRDAARQARPGETGRPHLVGRARVHDAGGPLRGLPQGGELVVGALPDVVAVGLLLQRRDRLPRATRTSRRTRPRTVASGCPSRRPSTSTTSPGSAPR